MESEIHRKDPVITSSSENIEDVTRLGKGAGVSISGKIFGRGINFLSQAVMARLLGAESFGLFSIGWAILRIFSIIGPIGLDIAVIRTGGKYLEIDRSKFGSIFYLSTITSFFSGAVIGILLFLSAPFLSDQVFKKHELISLLQGFSLVIPLITSLRVVASASSVSQQVKYATYSEEISQPFVLIVIFIILFYALGWKLKGAVWAVGISYIFGLVLAVYYLVRLFPWLPPLGYPLKNIFHLSFLGELIQISIPSSLAVLFGSLMSWADRLFVGFFRSNAETGIYTTISLIAGLFVIILSGIKVICSPMIADLYSKNEMNRVEELYRISTKWGLYLSVPIFLIIGFSSREILGLFFSAEYAKGYIALIILSMAQVFNIGTGPLDILLIMTGYQKTWLAISGIALVGNCILDILLIPAYGIIGAAVGTTITITITFLYGIIKIKKNLNIRPYDYRFKKIVISAIITIIILFVVNSTFISSSLIKFAVNTGISFSVFTLALLVQRLDAEDRKFIELVKKKIQAQGAKNGP